MRKNISACCLLNFLPRVTSVHVSPEYILLLSNGYLNVTLTDSRKDITKRRLFKYIEKITIKNSKFSDKNSDNFHIYTQNIDCKYSLEQSRRGGSNEYPQSLFFVVVFLFCKKKYTL